MPRPDASSLPVDPVDAIADLADATGLHRVHVLAWRDLDDPEAGGSELHIDRVAAHWAQAGVEVTMRTAAAEGQPEVVQRNGYRAIRRSGRHTVFPAAAAAELTGRHGPRDGLIEIWNGMPFGSPVWARGPRIVFLHHLHGIMWNGAFPSHPRLASLGQFMERRVAPLAYRRVPIVTLSGSSRDELVDELGFASDRVSVVPPGIGEQYQPGRPPAEAPTILVVTRLMPSKRVDEVVRAVADLREDVPGVRLEVVGSGRELSALEELARQLGITDAVTFLGRVSDEELLDAYGRAWVVASASLREGWGMTLTEAAATGTPAVATDIPGHRDAVDDQVSGLLVPEDRPLTEALRRVLTDESLRTRLSTGALIHAQRFTWAATALGTFQILATDAQRRAG
jgi:glycosyltransferase involved in cell wall biosynthesis